MSNAKNNKSKGSSKSPMEIFKQLCENQMILQGERSEDVDFISFDYNDISIINPFWDEIGRKQVNPIEYYGEKFQNSDFYPLYILCKNYENDTKMYNSINKNFNKGVK